MPGIIWPFVANAPKAATKPSIAPQPINFSASGDKIKIRLRKDVAANVKECKVYSNCRSSEIID